jgi:hypothetical protein
MLINDLEEWRSTSNSCHIYWNSTKKNALAKWFFTLAYCSLSKLQYKKNIFVEMIIVTKTSNQGVICDNPIAIKMAKKPIFKGRTNACWCVKLVSLGSHKGGKHWH